MNKLRFGVIGTGFWSNFQIPGWLESNEVELVALCDKDYELAKNAGEKYHVNAIYQDANEMLEKEDLDFVDIITDVDTHLKFASMAAISGIDVVVQKPMAPNFRDAKKLVDVCKNNGVKLFVNENFRWQAPIRALKKVIDKGTIGRPFKGKITFCSAFPVFDNQPFLKELDRFIITDIGSHLFDIARFMFGEAETLYCVNQRVNNEIKGEDVANVLMKMKNGIHCFIEMSYASKLEKEVFPQTLILVEGEKGSVHLDADYELKITTDDGTTKEIIEPQLYDWIDPDYAVVHSSIVDEQMDILNGLKDNQAETTGEDNFETVRLVWAAYHSAENNTLVYLDNFND